tara:strand:- start:3237 stop:3641 length:405 start_codon:yes stop_codon:yes gene_type:complete
MKQSKNYKSKYMRELTPDRKIHFFKLYRELSIDVAEEILHSKSLINTFSIPLSEKNKVFILQVKEFSENLINQVSENARKVSEGDRDIHDVINFTSEKLLNFGTSNDYIATESESHNITLLISEYNLKFIEEIT